MKKLFAAAALLAGIAGPASVAAAHGEAATNTSEGRLVAATYNADTRSGTVTVAGESSRFTYRFSRSTDCGYSRGDTGDEVACRTLRRSTYDRKPVRVVWHRTANGRRLAELVEVTLR